ncbi:MAG: hypothetical protein ACJ8GO_00285 [Ramlibacter sp.]
MRHLADAPRHLLAATFLFLAASAAPAQTGTAADGNKATLAVAHNVYSVGRQVRPAGPVKGDFSAAGGKVVVDQPIDGDASLAGGSIDVRAPVGDDLRAAGADVTVESTIGGELVAAGANITVAAAGAVARGAALYGSNVSMDGRIGGDLVARASKVTINGEVVGNVRVAAAEIELGPKARIGGSMSYATGSELKKAEGATVAGPIVREPERAARRASSATLGRGTSWLGGGMSFLALLAVAALFVLLAPRFGASAAGRIQASPWLALAAGFATVIAVPVLVVLLFITVLGIPVGIAIMALYPALLLAGFVVGVLFISRLLAVALRKQVPDGFAGGMGYFAIGLLLILLVAKVPLVGAMFVGLLGLAGVGACVLELYRRRYGPGAGDTGGHPAAVVPAAVA